MVFQCSVLLSPLDKAKANRQARWRNLAYSSAMARCAPTHGGKNKIKCGLSFYKAGLLIISIISVSDDSYECIEVWFTNPASQRYSVEVENGVATRSVCCNFVLILVNHYLCRLQHHGIDVVDCEVPFSEAVSCSCVQFATDLTNNRAPVQFLHCYA